MGAVDEAMQKLGLTKRKKVLGVPVGPKQVDWRKAASVGASASASAGALGAAARSLLGQRDGDEGDGGSGGGPLARVLGGGEELMEEGKDALGSVTEVGEKVSEVSDAVSGESSTFGKLKAAVQAIGGGDDEPGDEKKQRLIISESIDVAVPPQRAYDTWTDFEEFEEIFRAVQSAEGSDESDEEAESDEGGEGEDEDETAKVELQAKIAFSSRTWTSEITSQTPGERIAWTSSGDVDHAGAVSFHELAERLTRIHLEMEYHPTGLVEKFANLFLTVRHRVRKDLRLFKHYLEMQAVEGEEGYQYRKRDELRDDLQERGLPVSGTKDELVERLEADDADGGDES